MLRLGCSFMAIQKKKSKKTNKFSMRSYEQHTHAPLCLVIYFQFNSARFDSAWGAKNRVHKINKTN